MENTVFCCQERMFTSPLPSNKCPSVECICFEGMCLKIRCLAMAMHITIHTYIHTYVYTKWVYFLVLALRPSVICCAYTSEFLTNMMPHSAGQPHVGLLLYFFVHVFNLPWAVTVLCLRNRWPCLSNAFRWRVSEVVTSAKKQADFLSH
jgi:hypothetical protein